MATIPDPRLRATPAWRQRAAGFWRWWSSELVRLVPERFAALGGAARVPQVMLEGDEVIVLEPGSADAVAGRVSLALEPQQVRGEVRALLERAGESRQRARLVLGETEALTRRATMPAATEENLPQVLAFEMDRLTPFRADDVYFDYRVVSRDAAAGTLALLLAVARRDIVDRGVAALRELGLTVEGVLPRQEAGRVAGALNLMPTEQRGERETPRERLLKRVLALVALALLFVVLAYPPYTKREQIKVLHPVEAKAQGEAQAAGRLAQELERLAGDYNFLLAKKHGVPPTLVFVEELSRLLPDNTWVQQMDLKAAGKVRELQIQGETASSSKLIEILSQSTLMQNVNTRGTVTRGSQPGTERFAIVAEAKSRPLPEATAVAQLSTPVAAPVPVPAPPAPPKAEAPRAEASKPVPAKVEPVPPKGAKPAPGK